MKNLLKFKNFLLAVFVLFAHAVIAQTITGTVSSEDGHLPGATIIVKVTNNGTTTDFDGNFSIEASSSDVLVVSFVGFSSQEVSVGDNDQITVNLQADNELEEVVITGYGSQKEKEITSAVTKITADEFNKGPINTTACLLECKVAGLSIYSKGGNPNAGSTIRLRGITSFGDNTSPLFVIDGVPGSSIDNVDPNDIETINVLKDGSAAAIYGSRGSSGVIIVTTKKGTQGRVKLSYNGQYGVSEKMNQIKIMTPAEFRAFGGADLGGNVSNSANSIDHARLATSMSGVNAIALEMQQQRENASARDFLNNGEQESNSSGNLPQSQLSKIASATDAKSANGMTFAQVQDLLAESPFDMSQLTRNLRKGREGESQEVTLRLRPDELGTLTMKVRQLGDRLQVEMQVENPHVKQLVESDLNQLRNRFLDKEFNFSEMELTVNIDARSDTDSQAFTNQGRYQEDTTAVSQKQRLNAVQESASVVRPQTRSDGSLNLYA